MLAHNILVNPTSISASDRSIHYGDASFTSMYAENHNITLLSEHIQRLQDACLGLDIKFTDWDELHRTLQSLVALQREPLAIKVIVTRGSGGRGYQPPEQQTPICIISTHSAESMQAQGNVKLLMVSDICLPSHDKLEGLKHTNRLAQVLAKQEALNMHCDDVLMCDYRRHVIEASSANVFYKLDGCWYTPPLNSGGVKGLMRNAFLLYLQDLGLFVNQASHHIEQLCSAQSILLSNAVKGVRQVDKLHYQNADVLLTTDLGELIAPFLSSILQVEQNV
ncbi:aminodeoxychorismate lyase [Glaciecola sp. SC05]|uniref:aminodeoxychorismate lyase n=1 Tax=Glaciecola sp. SC05 TaxID=1987355 RepID=UPI003529157B